MQAKVFKRKLKTDIFIPGGTFQMLVRVYFKSGFSKSTRSDSQGLKKMHLNANVKKALQVLQALYRKAELSL